MPVLREIQYEKKNQNDFVAYNFGMNQGKKKGCSESLLIYFLLFGIYF